jgi:uncharacterized phage protein (TIGR01671 family)
MQREIEFRAAREDNRKLVYGNLIVTRHYTTSEKQDGDFDVKLESVRTQIVNIHFSADVDPDTVDQYTGLFDRNGEMIFEGDILRKRDGFIDYIIFVRWDNEYCGFVYDFRPQKYAPHDGVITESLYHFCPDEYELIGNIHENKELWGGRE